MKAMLFPRASGVPAKVVFQLLMAASNCDELTPLLMPLSGIPGSGVVVPAPLPFKSTPPTDVVMGPTLVVDEINPNWNPQGISTTPEIFRTWCPPCGAQLREKLL